MLLHAKLDLRACCRQLHAHPFEGEGEQRADRPLYFAPGVFYIEPSQSFSYIFIITTYQDAKMSKFTQYILLPQDTLRIGPPRGVETLHAPLR